MGQRGPETSRFNDAAKASGPRFLARCMDELVREAKCHGVHLVQITDDQGVKLIAASIHPFQVLS